MIDIQTVTVNTTDGSGTGYSDPVVGRILQCQYSKDGSSPYADGVHIAVTGNDTGIDIWTESAVNASCQRRPDQACHLNTDGSSLTFDGTQEVTADLVLSHERIKVAVTDAGAGSRTGIFRFWIDR